MLLLHVSALNAHAMPTLLVMLERRGYAVVPLEAAMRDPIYLSEDGYTGPAGMTWLHPLAITAGARGAAFAGEPAVPAWVEEAARPGG